MAHRALRLSTLNHKLLTDSTLLGTSWPRAKAADQRNAASCNGSSVKANEVPLHLRSVSLTNEHVDLGRSQVGRPR